MKALIAFFLIFALGFCINAPNYVPSTSPGYNDCFVCIINGGSFCTGNAIAFTTGTVP